MMKRNTLTAVLLAFMWLATSCVPQAQLPNLQPKEEQPTLRIWLWPGSGYEVLIQDYTSRHPEVGVEIVTLQNDDILPNLMIAFATHSDAPDLVLLDSPQINQLKKFPAEFHNFYDYGDETEHFLDWKLKQAENEDGDFLFALPADIGPVALAYRRDLFEAAGLPVTRDVVAAMFRSWDQLEQAGLQLKKKTGIFMFDNLTNVYLSYLNQYKLNPIDAKSGGKSSVYKSRIKEAWDRAVRIQKLGLNAGLQSQTPAWASGAVNGRFAVVLGPSWIHGLMKKNAPATSGKWDLARPPGEPSNWNGTFVALPQTSRFPDEAYKLASWLTSPSQQLTNFMLNGNFPSTPESYASSALIGLHDPFFNDAPVGQIYSYTALRYKGGFEDNDMTETDRLIRDALRRIETEGADPASLWAKIAEEIGKMPSTEE